MHCITLSSKTSSFLVNNVSVKEPTRTFTPCLILIHSFSYEYSIFYYYYYYYYCGGGGGGGSDEVLLLLFKFFTN